MNMLLEIGYRNFYSLISQGKTTISDFNNDLRFHIIGYYSCELSSGQYLILQNKTINIPGCNRIIRFAVPELGGVGRIYILANLLPGALSSDKSYYRLKLQ